MIRLPHARALLCAALFSLALPLAGCGGSAARTATPTAAPSAAATIAVTAAPTPPAATPTPDTELLLRDGGIAIIETAYNRLLDQYIDPVDPAALLAQAWAGVRQQAAAQGVAAPPTPSFAGDRVAAFAAFRQAYVAAVPSLDARQARFGAIRTMAASLRDCHTFFLNPVASDTLVQTRQGNGSVGVGVELTGTPPLVTEVIAGGPAARAGVLVGDRVVAVGGTDTTALGPASTLDLINGDEGTSVALTLRRPGAAALLPLTITRERVIPRNIESRVIPVAAVPGGIGYVRIRNFVDSGISDDLRATLNALTQAGATKWIIDLRGNPGGRLDTDAISLFIKDGVIVRDRGRDRQPQQDRATGDVLPSVPPIAMLVNNRTGSVAEIFASTLQEYGKAIVVGQTTNGCVGFTDIEPLGDGSSLAVTTAVNLGPLSEKPLNGVGVIPDVPVDRTQADISAGLDPQLDAAVATLARG